MYDNKLPLFILMLMLLGMAPAWALKSDTKQPIEIESNNADIDEGKDLSVYVGNVVITQGSLKIWADKVTVYGLKSADKMVAIGKPARFKQRPDGKTQDLKGRGLRLEYFANDEKLYIYKKGHIEQEDSTFSSERIVYDVANARVKAGAKQLKKHGTARERVRVTIQPRKD